MTTARLKLWRHLFLSFAVGSVVRTWAAPELWRLLSIRMRGRYIDIDVQGTSRLARAQRTARHNAEQNAQS